MKTNQDFFAQFDPKIASEIVEFGKRLSRTKADVYLLMARKAACLVHCLEEMNHLSLDGYVTSERILDMQSDWLKDKTVIIIDDTIISGTTLFGTIEKLKKIGVGSIQVYVLSVNKNHFVPNLLVDENGDSYLAEPYLRLENTECIKACSDIVNAISIFPRPYDIDFPYFSQISFGEKDYNRLISFSNWVIDETTSFLQDNNDIFSLSFSPTDSIKKRIDETIGLGISEHSMIKIRTFGEKHEKKTTQYSIRILPIVVFHPMKIETVDELFYNLPGVKENKSHFAIHFQSYASKLRLIQYVVSTRLAEFWLESEYIQYDLRSKHDLFTLKLLFTQDVITEIFSIVESSNLPLYQNEIDLSHLDKLEVDELPENSTFAIDDEEDTVEILQLLLLEPFLKLYYEKERKAWELVKTHKKEVFSLPEYKTIIDRLKTGYSISFLKKLISSHTDFDPRKVVSSFLDKAIDAGIAVPIIVQQGETIYRAYRHGEDVPFGEKEEKLFAILLTAYFSESGQTEIQKLAVEKLAVLLLRIGVQNKFLNPIVANVAPKESVASKEGHMRSIASVKTYLHGPVIVISKMDADQKLNKKPYLESDENSSWLTRILVKKGILIKEKDQKKYKLGKIPEISLDSNLEGKAENVGQLFGYAVRNGLMDDRNDFVVLSTTIYPTEIVAALAAEINIFYSGWQDLKKKVENAAKPNASVLEIASEIRSRANVLFTAINSGQAKFFWFLDKAGLGLIDYIASNLPSGLFRNTWNEFWSPNKDWQESSLDNELFASIIDQGLWLVSINVYMRLWECTVLSQNTEIKIQAEVDKAVSRSVDELGKFLGKLKQFSESNRTKEIIPFLEAFLVNPIFSTSEKALSFRLEIFKKISSLTFRAKSYLDNAELLVSRFGKIEEIKRFSYALVISVFEQDEVKRRLLFYQIESVVEEFKTKLAANNELTELIVRIPEDRNILENTLLYGISGGIRSNLAIRLADKILHVLHGKFGIKCTLFSQMPEHNRIKTAGENNTNIKFGYFWNQVEGFPTSLFSQRSDTSNLVVITEKKEHLPDELTKLKFQHNYSITGNTEHRSDEFPPMDYTVKQYKYMPEERKADIGIITIVPPETRAVLKMLGRNAADDFKIAKRPYYSGQMPTASGATKSIVLTQQMEQGNLSIINAFNAMVNDFHPKLVILLGIAGSIDDDIKLCDVVVGNQVIFYETRKEKPKETSRRGEVFRFTPKVKTLINKFFIAHGEIADFDASDNSFQNNFSAIPAPIASGQAVIADSASEILSWLKEFNSKVGAVEMEAGGFMQAFDEGQLSENQPTVGVMVIRGICDHADVKKDDKWRVPASENAVKVLEEMLKLVTDELDE